MLTLILISAFFALLFVLFIKIEYSVDEDALKRKGIKNKCQNCSQSNLVIIKRFVEKKGILKCSACNEALAVLENPEDFTVSTPLFTKEDRVGPFE